MSNIKHDWIQQFALFRSKIASQKDYTQKQFAIDNGFQESQVSNGFSKAREILRSQHRSATEDIIWESSPKAAKKLAEQISSDDENVAQKASVAVLDRAGHSPQVAQINVTQAVQNNLVLPPMFLGPAQADVTHLLSGEE